MPRCRVSVEARPFMDVELSPDRLKREFGACLPRRFDMHVQGILLSQFNSEVPGQLIAQMAAKGLTILPIQYSNRAELFPYVSQLNTIKTRFVNNPRRPVPQSPIESMLSHSSLRDRVIAAEEASGRSLCISYLLSDQDEAAALIVRNKHCVFLIKEEGTTHAERLRQDIVANGLQEKFLVEALEAEEVTV